MSSVCSANLLLAMCCSIFLACRQIGVCQPYFACAQAQSSMALPNFTLYLSPCRLVASPMPCLRWPEPYLGIIKPLL